MYALNSIFSHWAYRIFELKRYGIVPLPHVSDCFGSAPSGRRLIPPRPCSSSSVTQRVGLLVAQFGVPNVEMGDPLGSLELQQSTFVGRASAELPNH